MYLTRFNNAEDFYRRAENFLLQNEVQCNVIIGICTNLIRYPDRVQEAPYLAVVELDGSVCAVAVRTPPYNPLLSVTEEIEAIDLIARDLYSVWKILPGVTGPKEITEDFAETWQNLSGQPYRVDIAERLFRLDQVNPVNGVSGNMRRATPADRDILIDWLRAFYVEALPAEPYNEDALGRTVDSALEFETRGYYIWENNGQPVSFAGYTGPTPNSMRIGPVYTPTEYRGKGYASALVAGISQMLLDSGKQFLTLYTDLSNPTSNHIYQEIGYYGVLDVSMYRFDDPLPGEDWTKP